MALTDASPRVIYQAGPGIPIVLAGTVVRGDLIGNSGGWVQADANGDIKAEYIAGEDGVSTETITAYKQAVITNYTLGTARSLLYLSDTAGAVSETASQQIVGTVLAADTVEVNLVPLSLGRTAIAASGLPSAAYGFSSVVTQTSAKSDGIAGYFEGHVAGTPTGHSFAFGAWMNVDTAPGAYEMRAADIGMYARGQDLSNTALVGINIGMHADAANPPSSNYPIRFNCFQTGSTPDGMFRATNHEAVAHTLGAAETATKTGDIAVSIAGTTYYIRTYDGTS